MTEQSEIVTPYRIVFTRTEGSLRLAVSMVGNMVPKFTEDGFRNALMEGFDDLLKELLNDKAADARCVLFAANAAACLAAELGISVDEGECLRMLSFCWDMFVPWESLSTRMKEITESMTRLTEISSYVHEFINTGEVDGALLERVENEYCSVENEYRNR